MRTLFERLRAAAEAFRDPAKTDEPTFAPRVGVTINEDRMRSVVEDMFADAFEQFDAPDVDHKTTGYIDTDRVAELSEDLAGRIHGVPDDALVQRIVIDAVNEVTIYYDEPRRVARPGDDEAEAGVDDVDIEDTDELRDAARMFLHSNPYAGFPFTEVGRGPPTGRPPVEPIREWVEDREHLFDTAKDPETIAGLIADAIAYSEGDDFPKTRPAEAAVRSYVEGRLPDAAEDVDAAVIADLVENFVVSGSVWGENAVFEHDGGDE